MVGFFGKKNISLETHAVFFKLNIYNSKKLFLLLLFIMTYKKCYTIKILTFLK